MEYRCYPDDGAVGLNMFDTAVAGGPFLVPAEQVVIGPQQERPATVLAVLVDLTVRKF